MSKIIKYLKDKISMWLRRRKAAKSLEPLKKKAETIEEENRVLEARNKQLNLIAKFVIQVLILYVIFGSIFNWPYAVKILKMIFEVKKIVV